MKKKVQRIEDIKYDPDKVLKGEEFDKAIEVLQIQIEIIEKKRQIDNWDKLNKPMTI
jgi:hypothetical protein